MSPLAAALVVGIALATAALAAWADQWVFTIAWAGGWLASQVWHGRTVSVGDRR